ncbi:MAG TPA: Tol-Pal system beta propeller repeat protein TolB [Candidatus Binatia bacterium]|nr:Tol-Pal system beta propeller repeat protein TolB [Candidatus Binatia bacterium]
MNRTLALLLLLAALPANAALEITVTGGDTGARPVAIVPFAQGPEFSLDIADIIQSDLARSGQFQPLARKDMLEKPSDAAQVDWRNWRAVSVDAAVVGQVRRLPTGLSAKFQVLDVLRAQVLLAMEVPIPDPRRGRAVAHYIADRIYEKLTGVPGYFSSQIAYVAVTGPASARQFQIVIADADGAGPTTVATSREPLMSPVWSPDRRQLSYVGYERGRSAIYIHTLATGELRKLVSERGINGAPAWSPDGTRMAVTMSFESNPDIYVIDLASGARKQITSHYAIDTEPTWSPDGREIAFTSDRGGQPQVYLVSAGGGEAKRVTFEGKQNSAARYSPDGKRLALVNYDGSSYRIGLLELASRELRLVSDGPLDESPSFAPNGAVVIYAAQSRNELATVSVDGRIRQRLAQPGEVREPVWAPAAR